MQDVIEPVPEIIVRVEDGGTLVGIYADVKDAGRMCVSEMGQHSTYTDTWLLTQTQAANRVEQIQFAKWYGENYGQCRIVLRRKMG